MRVLVTRPLPGGAATVARLRAAGHEALLAPLLELEAVDWDAPETAPQAVMMTSAAAVRLAGAAALAYRAVPMFAVGAATAAAAREAGFADVRVGGSGVQDLLMAMADAGIGTALHLAGEDRTAVDVPDSLTLAIRTVYRARLRPLAALPPVDFVLLYSARTAAHFAGEVDRLGAVRSSISVAAISPAALAAAGPGWRRAVAAESPDEDALLAAIGAAWQKPKPNL
jgi:uroporphyrinogen-III synthase